MTTFSLREAAEQAGVSKSTIFRAVQSGRLSAARTQDGGFAIDPAELCRVYPPKSAGERAATGSAGQNAIDTDVVALRVRNAELEAEIKGLRAMADELRQSRDKWESQAERLVRQLPAPQPDNGVIITPPPPGSVPAASAVRVPDTRSAAVERRGWWPFRRAG